MLRRILAIAILAVPTYLSTPARAQTPEEWARCLDTPDCVSWIEYQTELARWYDAINLNVFYDALTRARNPCDDDWPIPAYIVQRESGCRWDARNPECPPCAGGAFQLIQSTANGVAQTIGHPELIGVNAADWPPALQEAAADALRQARGLDPWSLTR